MFHSSEKGFPRDVCRKMTGEEIRKNNPDIVCFEEFYVTDKTMADTLFGEYGHRHYHLFRTKAGTLFGDIILSKYPIKKSGDISFPHSTNLCIFADIEFRNRIIRIYDNHLESYNLSLTALALKLSKHRAKDKNIRNELLEVHEKVRGTTIKRSAQVSKILNVIKKDGSASIICGDFNDTPMSYTYHKLATGRKDAFKDSGEGAGATFIPLWPFLRIDYILFPREYESTNFRTIKSRLSDHYPISAEIIVK
ncbi:MAG: endonuclease/exonuclease/phosphatase family protein [Bacteroidales bacterium]|jgi:endonuclease/exonuclease/phosphatase family metal-dependent hydrolase|nr:endonuclease/exonuclease/phosphatase family protein [Bacteroidales bacterium]